MSREGDEHLIRLIGMMGSTSSGGDGEAVNAFRMATRALEKRGITWREFAEKALRPPTTSRPIWQGDPAPRGNAGTGATSREAPPPPPPPPPPPQQPIKTRKSSFGVPAAIGGIVRVLDDDRRARILVLEVEGKDHVFGPILAHGGGGVRDNILAAEGRYATLRVRPPRQEGAMPVAVGCSSL